MARTGRPKKPKALHLAEGTHRPDRHGAVDDPTDVKAAGKPVPPEELDEHGSWLWREVTESMPGGVITAADSAALFAACRWWSQWRNLDAVLQQEPGDYKIGCQAGMAWKYTQGLLRELGLTPSARSSLKLAPADGKKKDKLGAFLEGEG